jgi:hypothetical protein
VSVSLTRRQFVTLLTFALAISDRCRKKHIKVFFLLVLRGLVSGFCLVYARRGLRAYICALAISELVKAHQGIRRYCVSTPSFFFLARMLA